MKTPDSLKLNVRSVRTMFGKTNGQYVASIAGIECSANSKEQAAIDLAERIDLFAKHTFTRRYLVTPKGNVFALYHVPGGWCYDIIHADKPGAQSPGSCMMGENYVEAYDAMKRHYESFCADESLASKAA